MKSQLLSAVGVVFVTFGFVVPTGLASQMEQLPGGYYSCPSSSPSDPCWASIDLSTSSKFLCVGISPPDVNAGAWKVTVKIPGALPEIRTWPTEGSVPLDPLIVGEYQWFDVSGLGSSTLLYTWYEGPLTANYLVDAYEIGGASC